MTDKDIRWQQRFDNYQRALERLKNAVLLSKERKLSDLEEQGVIKSFEFTFELAWNVMKDYLISMGLTDIIGSKGAIREAFKNNLITDGQKWMSMIEDRNLSAHNYDEETKNKILKKIIEVYCPEFIILKMKMSSFIEGK
jgi:nucleotidyltransferase substrate binding protein (TIGR01987 family)